MSEYRFHPQFRGRLNNIIFGTEPGPGRWFDVALIIAIVASVVLVMAESIDNIARTYSDQLHILEWLFTLLFTLEYLVRIYCARQPWRYITSFYGVVDLLAIIPTYLSLFVADAQYLLIIRSLRVLRIFKVLKLSVYLREAQSLLNALRQSGRKIFVFFFAVLVLTMVFGSVMYVFEGPEHGFTSIPRSIYWAIVTITTVGYGDITPQTNIGQAIAALAMLIGYAIIAVPTSIITSELIRELTGRSDQRVCLHCDTARHQSGAHYCQHCGTPLPMPQPRRP